MCFLCVWILILNTATNVNISKAARDDKYFHVGKMIATSLVHGGTGPQFLSETLFNHLTGKSTVNDEARIEDITDDTMRASLIERCDQINNALKMLHRHTTQHSQCKCTTVLCIQFYWGIEFIMLCLVCKEKLPAEF